MVLFHLMRVHLTRKQKKMKSEIKDDIQQEIKGKIKTEPSKNISFTKEETPHIRR